jgi:alkylresorcinol/alkylpyrone synthase
LRIASVGRALPPHVHTQAEVLDKLSSFWGDDRRMLERLALLHANTGVTTRHFALPLEAYLDLATFGDSNRAWLTQALELGEAAVRDALERAGMVAGDIDAFFATTITGVTCPSIDARLMNKLPFRTDVKRVPIFGLGCVAGAAGIARAADYLRAFPEQAVLLLSVELCSLTFQKNDRSMAHMVATGLFGDGAAAVVMVGEERARRLGLTGPRVEATRSVFYPGTEDIMGWDISEQGFRVLLSPRVPELARERLAVDVRLFLADHGLTPRDVARWVAHPGGPKVLQGIEQALELDKQALAVSWKVLAAAGNISSASVLLILRETLDAPPPAPGSPGVLFAMGPAFGSEVVLLRW